MHRLVLADAVSLSRPRPRAVPATLLLGLAALAVPALAEGATLTSGGGVLTYTAGPGEHNVVSLSTNPTLGACVDGVSTPCLTLTDGSFITISSVPPECRAAEEFAKVSCPIPTAIVVSLGDGDDVLDDWNGPTTVSGGLGGDMIRGNDGNDTLVGNEGLDFLVGGPGNDSLDGGQGDDYLDSTVLERSDADTRGTDVIRGGPDRDTLSYGGRSDSLTISLDGVANDGAPGENDLVGGDVEVVEGGGGADVLTGDSASNYLAGLAGNDQVSGGAGDDTLDGGPGNDTVDGEDGTDTVAGGDGDDTVVGGPGIDAFWGDQNPDCYSCPDGQDRIFAADGVAETQFDCGGGTDVATVDGADTVSLVYGRQTCETIDVSPIAESGPTGGGRADRTRPVLRRLTLARVAFRAAAGTTIRYRLSERAAVTVRVERLRPGRRSRYVRLAGTLRQAGRVGPNVLRFKGRLAGKRLAPGRYRFVLMARDAARNVAAPKRIAFRVLR